MVTSEFMAAGLLPAISDDLGVSIGSASLLISGFAAGQVLGAWLLGMPLARFGARAVLPGLLTLFAAVQIVGVLAPWPVMLALRIVAGFAMSAYFAISLGTVTKLVPGVDQSRATAVVFAGVTIGTTLGLPLATFAGQALAWQWAFHLDTVLVLVAAVAIATLLPTVEGVPSMSLREMTRPLADGRLWLTFGTAALAIGGTLAGFGFFSAILERITGIDPLVVPWLLALYGAASVFGNWLVGRLTPTGATRIVAIGSAVLAAGLVALALAPTTLPVVVAALLAVGVSGVSLNSAHAARSIAVGGTHPAVMAMLPTIVTGGILMGTAVGGAVVESGFGLLAPLWVGAAFALLGIATLVPEWVAKRAPQARSNVSAEAREVCPTAG